MAESSDELRDQTVANTNPPTGIMGVARRAAGWTASQAAGWVITFLAGGGTVFALSQLDLIKITSEVERIIQANVTGRLDRLHADLTRLDRSVDSDHQDVLRTQGELLQRLQSEATGVHRKLDTAEGARQDLLENMHTNHGTTVAHLQALERSVRSASQQAANSTREIMDGQSSLTEQIQALSDQFESYRRAIVGQLEELREEGRYLINGKTTIQDEDRLKVEEWIAKANYIVRSLTIPTEAGLLRDTAVVKEELRVAMKRFAKEQHPEARVEHARRALWVVEAITSLASGGRIP